jgi:6-phospho-3-hexuloisomerase
MARKAKELGVTIALITIFPQSSIAGMAQSVVQIAAPTSKAVSGYASIQPGGSCFEQSMLMLLDAIVIRLTEELKVDANAGIGLRHANIE